MDESLDGLSARPMKCELNILSKADGSAILSQGNTVALSALYGPLEVKYQRIQNDGIPVFVAYRSKLGKQGVYERTYESIIQSACEALIFPKQFCRYEIQIVVQELQDNGSVLAAAINSACLALINAGIEMACLVAAVTCAIDQHDNYVIDPDKSVIEKAKMVMTVGFESVRNDIVASHIEGNYSIQAYETAVNLCKNAAQNIFSYYKSIVQKYSAVL